MVISGDWLCWNLCFWKKKNVWYPQSSESWLLDQNCMKVWISETYVGFFFKKDRNFTNSFWRDRIGLLQSQWNWVIIIEYIFFAFRRTISNRDFPEDAPSVHTTDSAPSYENHRNQTESLTCKVSSQQPRDLRSPDSGTNGLHTLQDLEKALDTIHTSSIYRPTPALQQKPKLTSVCPAQLGVKPPTDPGAMSHTQREPEPWGLSQCMEKPRKKEVILILVTANGYPTLLELDFSLM